MPATSVSSVGFRTGAGLNTLKVTQVTGGPTSPPKPQPPSVSPTPPSIDVARVITSQSSSVAFHSTLFEDFNLIARSTYNFYTADELLGFDANPSASLSSLPRYVTLTWTPAPAPREFPVSRKDLRPLDPRIQQVPPALDVRSARGSVANGYIGPGTVQALLVRPIEPPNPPRFDEDLFLFMPSAAGQHAANVAHEDSEFHITSIPQSTVRTRVSFVDPSIAGALDPTRIAVANDHAHLASLGAFAKLAPGLEVISEFNQDVPLRNPVPKFPIRDEAPDLSYTGYIVERYTLGVSGSMELTRTFNVDGRDQDILVDREVVFGGRYAYRIRVMVQWVHGPTVGFFGSSSLDRTPNFDTSAGSKTRQASYYIGEWSDWAKTQVLDVVPPEPPDELTVMPMSAKKQIRITWKMPNDPQRDVSSLRLFRSEGVAGRYTDWTWVAEFVPSNGAFVDSLVSNYEESQTTYMYAMCSVSFHGEVSPLSERIIARLTDRSRYLGEYPVRLAGPRGDDPTAHARGPQRPMPIELVASDRFTAYIRGGQSSLPLFDRSYILEVQSLSTGERAEVILNVDTTDVGLTPGGTARPA